MTTGSDRPESGLSERLRELDTAGVAEDGVLVEQMFSDMKARCDESDRTLAGFLRSRSTTARRLIVLSIFGVLGAIGWFAFPLIADEARSIQWTASLAAFCVLIVIAMFMVTRPVHRVVMRGRYLRRFLFCFY